MTNTQNGLSAAERETITTRLVVAVREQRLRSADKFLAAALEAEERGDARRCEFLLERAETSLRLAES